MRTASNRRPLMVRASTGSNSRAACGCKPAHPNSERCRNCEQPRSSSITPGHVSCGQKSTVSETSDECAWRASAASVESVMCPRPVTSKTRSRRQEVTSATRPASVRPSLAPAVVNAGAELCAADGSAGGKAPSSMRTFCSSASPSGVSNLDEERAR